MKLSKELKTELSFFVNGKGKIQYASKCRHCKKSCKQSFRVRVYTCPKFEDKRF